MKRQLGIMSEYLDILNYMPKVKDLRLCVGPVPASHPLCETQSFLTIEYSIPKPTESTFFRVPESILAQLLAVRASVLCVMNLSHVNLMGRLVPVLVQLGNVLALELVTLEDIKQVSYGVESLDTARFRRDLIRFSNQTNPHLFIADGPDCKKQLRECVEWLSSQGY
ncbi:hypothetical protein EJ08DRAFT_430296 [Tothia fuscella]|uniref:Uncharacterized protein n=1 Tax=Tothia fuscella TaxID=1048955 RepID=A0A9P4P0W1_9PEZI|nr:hypothetical protein EJ08DRAFT_430296 [Tothia fuscella]